MKTARLGVAFTLLLVTACKSKPQAVQASDPGLPGPATQLGEHLTPAFTEVAAFMRMTATRLSASFAENQVPASTMVSCEDPRMNIPMRPERHQILSCQGWIDAQNNPHVAAKFSNNWLILLDPQGTRRVTKQEFDAFSPRQ